jgi:hypothetical protein
LNAFQSWNAQIAPDIIGSLEKLKGDTLDQTTQEALQSARRALENKEQFLVSEPIIRAGFTVYSLAQSGDPDYRADFEELLLSHPSPLTIIPVSMLVNEAGLMLFWDRFERFLIFDDLFSQNLNRIRYVRIRLALLAHAEDLSETKNIVRKVFESLGSPERLRELDRNFCSEKHINDTRVIETIEIVCGPSVLTMEHSTQIRFIEELTTTVLDKIRQMSFVDIWHMFLAEGGQVARYGPPLKLVFQSALELIDQLVAEETLRFEDARQAIYFLKVGASASSKLLSDLYNIPEGYLDFDNPYAFTGNPPKE